MVLRKRSRELQIIALVAVTVVWAIALYSHIQAYNRMVQNSIEEWIARGFDEDYLRGILDFVPFWVWRFGPALVISAFIIFLAWVRVIILTFQYMLKSHKRNNV